MPDFRFRRSNRLLTPSDFQPLFDAPDFRVSGPGLLMLARRQAPPAEPRLGLVIGRRRVRKAILRNRIRRLARESFRHRKVELAGLDILLLVRADARAVEPGEWRHRLEALWDKLLAKAVQA